MFKGKLIPAYNCDFHLGKQGKLTIVATPSFTVYDSLKTYRLAKLHAKYKKIKKPIKWLIIPTLVA